MPPTASTPLMIRIRAGLARLPLGRLAALTLGGAVAFFCLAMPGDLLTRLLAASGVSHLVAGATPPFGAVPRALIAFAVGSLAFLAVWGGFALADRTPASSGLEPPLPPAPTEEEPLPAARPRPLLAMADVHDILELTDPLPPLAPPSAPLRPRPPPPGPQDSLPALVARLEAGLARRAARRPAAPGAWPDDRVRAALSQLHRLVGER